MEVFKIFLSALALVGGCEAVIAQTWIQATNAPPLDWRFIASSADGNKLLAVNTTNYSIGGTSYTGGLIFISTNSGADWTQATNMPLAFWADFAMSADGKNVAGLVPIPHDSPLPGGLIYTSTNYGATWTSNNTPSKLLRCIASSADGTRLVAGAADVFNTNSSWIYSSTNFGATWVTNSAPSEYWFSIASSADGSKLVAAGTNPNTTSGQIYTSVDSGKNWRLTSAPQAYWFPVASSANGRTLIAANYLTGQVYVSTNSGTNWILTTIPSDSQFSVASSADGTRLIAAQSAGGKIFTSSDSGATWTQANLSNLPYEGWNHVASSADGNRLAAVSSGAAGGVICFAQTTPMPRLELVPSGSNLALSWLIPSMAFVLQQSTNLTSWDAVPKPVTFNFTNLQNQVSVSKSNQAGFFRLSTP